MDLYSFNDAHVREETLKSTCEFELFILFSDMMNQYSIAQIGWVFFKNRGKTEKMEGVGTGVVNLTKKSNGSDGGL